MELKDEAKTEAKGCLLFLEKEHLGKEVARGL